MITMLKSTHKTILAILPLVVFLVCGSLTSAFSQDQLLKKARELKTHGVLMEAAEEYEKYVKQAPNDAEARIEYVKVLLDLKKIDQSIPHIEVLQRQKPNDPRVIAFANVVKNRRDNLKQSRLEELKARINQPNPPPALLLEYARYLINANQFNDGVAMYNKYLAQKPKDTKVRLELAQQYAWKQQYRSSRAQLNIILTNNSSDATAWELLGDIYSWQNDEERALNAYQNALKANPGNEKAKSQIRKITTDPGFRERRIKRRLEKDTTGPALLEMAHYLLELNRIYEADTFVKKRLQHFPDDKQAQELTVTINALIVEAQNKQIEEYLKRLTVNPTDSTALLTIGQYYASKSMFTEALELYSTYLNLYPNDYNVRLERAYIFTWSGDPSKAITEFRTIAFIAEYSRRANLGLAEALLNANENYDEAELIFRRDLIDFPDDNNRAKLGLAESLRRQGRYDDARELYQEITESEPGNKQALDGMDLLSQDFGPLISFLERELQKEPEDPYPTYRRLAALYYDSNRLFESEDQVLLFLDKFPDDSRMIALLERIQSRKKQYLLEQIELTRIALQENPNDEELRIKYAKMLASNNRLADAIAQYRTVLENRPNDPQLKLSLAEIYGAGQQWKNVAEIYSHLADEFPSKFDYRYKAAQAYTWMGDYENAIENYNLAIQINPESVESHLALANSYRWSGDIYTAHDEYNAVLVLDPENKVARKALKEMTGTFFRGVQGSYNYSWDNEDFRLWDAQLNATANYSLKLHFMVGYGWLKYSQKDYTLKYDVTNEGNYLLGRINYYFDPNTRMYLEYRYQMFSEKNSDMYSLELEHEFDETTEFKGLQGRILYTSQDAILEVASTKGLRTWLRELRADKFGVWALYETKYTAFVEGQFHYLMISDDNTRSDWWLSGGYPLNPKIKLGLRYDNISAKFTAPEYWSPASYSTIMIWAKVSNKFSRWGYDLYGAIGKIRSTSNTVRQYSLYVGYKLSDHFNAGGGYSSIYTSREEGEYYQYGRWAFTLSWSK